MAHHSPDWRDLARVQAGAIARHQLHDCGLSEDAIRGLVERRDLIRLRPGVFTPRPVPSSFRQQAWCAVLWSGGTLSHRSAAQVWGLPIPPTNLVHVTVDPAVRMASNGVVLHRVRLPRADRSAMAGLPPLTNRVTTVLDLLRTEDFRPARDIFDRSIQKRWLDTDVVTRGLRERPGRAGNAQLRRLVAGAEPGAQAESERLLHRILKQAGITEWVAQYRVPTAKGYAYLDVGFPGQLIAIEVDGRRYHDVHSDAFESDRVRQNDLQARGWRFLRFTWRMLNDDPAYVIAQIIALLAS